MPRSVPLAPLEYDAAALPEAFLDILRDTDLFRTEPLGARQGSTVCEFPVSGRIHAGHDGYDWCRCLATTRVRHGGGNRYYLPHGEYIYTPRFLCNNHLMIIGTCIADEMDRTYSFSLLCMRGISNGDYIRESDPDHRCQIRTSGTDRCMNSVGWVRAGDDRSIPKYLCTFHMNRLPKINKFISLARKMGIEDPMNFKFKERRLP